MAFRNYIYGKDDCETIDKVEFEKLELLVNSVDGVEYLEEI